MKIHREYYRDPFTGEEGYFEWSNDSDAERDEETGELIPRDDKWLDPPSREYESVLPKLPGSGFIRRGPEWEALWGDQEDSAPPSVYRDS